MNYREAEDYVLSFTNYEKIPGVPYTLASYDLRRMDELLVPIGSPHLAVKTVHVTGTKGKGSTSAMIAEVLSAAGYRTALYTSPHLLTIRERFQIDRQMITEAEFAALVTELKPLIEEVNRRAAYGNLTTFEILTVVAFLWFQRQKVDYQVLEVGLGGRLDATNVCRPEVCVITSISLDHTEALGKTVDRIAAEKAGIIKPGCVVVSAPQAPEAARVIEETARKQATGLVRVGTDVTWRPVSADLEGQSLVVRGRRSEYSVRIPLLGRYQLENASVAVAALEALVERGAKVTLEHMARGLALVSWPGRLQILRREPFLVVDGAHNGYSAGKLVQAIREILRYDRCAMICGMSVDKDISGIVRELVALPARFIVTRANHPRAADPAAVAGEFAKHGVGAEIMARVDDALRHALAQAGQADLVCVTGSLFVVAEAITWAGEHP